VEDIHMRLGEGFAGRAVLEHRAIQVSDPIPAQDNLQISALWESEGFISYFATPLVVQGETKGVLEVFHRTRLDANLGGRDFLNTLADQAAIAIANAQLFEGLQHANMDLGLAYDATIEGWSRAMDLRDKETEGHTQRVTEMTLRLARSLRVNESELVHIWRGALLHDMGKLGVPDHILLKPGKLTEAEWVIMRQHPQLAYDMLSPIAYLRSALDIPYCHHEKWDGSGYPRQLVGEQIPLAARLFAVVDVWDALTSDRPYRKKWTKQKARQHILEQSGKHFDPRIVDIFMKYIEQEKG
jgi:HD-GYP domain-containing protein (c-di-GMP phosphodiesterase class II)